MRVVVQRAKEAKCIIDNKVFSSIDHGYVLLGSFKEGDDINVINKMIKKILNLRIFEDENDVMNKTILDVGGEILSISQFTLYGDARKGNRPSFVDSMRPEEANLLYDFFNETLSNYGIITKPGVFGGDMLLEPFCDGPVTIEMEY